MSGSTGSTKTKLPIDPEKPDLLFKVPWELGAMIKMSRLDLTIEFHEDDVGLYLRGRGEFPLIHGRA